MSNDDAILVDGFSLESEHGAFRRRDERVSLAGEPELFDECFDAQVALRPVEQRRDVSSELAAVWLLSTTRPALSSTTTISRWCSITNRETAR